MPQQDLWRELLKVLKFCVFKDASKNFVFDILDNKDTQKIINAGAHTESIHSI